VDGCLTDVAAGFGRLYLKKLPITRRIS